MPVTLTDKNILILTDVINGGGPPLSLSRGECAAIVALAETAPRCTVRIHPEEGLTISTPGGEREQHREELARRDNTLNNQSFLIAQLRQDLAQARSALEQATAGWQERENELRAKAQQEMNVVVSMLKETQAQAVAAEQTQQLLSNILVLMFDAKFSQECRSTLFERIRDRINSFTPAKKG